MESCKNHPNHSAGYYSSEQPWLKYCKECALSVALCGKKIEKELTKQERERKGVVTGVANDMKKVLEGLEQSGKSLSKLTDYFEEAARPLTGLIQEVQAVLSHLSKAKEDLQRLYSEEIGSRLSRCYQRQSQGALRALELRKELESLQSGYCGLLEKEEPFFEERIAQWREMVGQATKGVMNEEEYHADRGKFMGAVERFYDTFQGISSYSLPAFTSAEPSTWRDGPPQDEFDMTLTPIDANSLNQSLVQGELQTKSRHFLKLRTQKKSQQQSSRRGSTSYSHTLRHK